MVTARTDLRTAGAMNAFTVDVEDYFQVSAFDAHISRCDWERFPSRVENSTDALLELLERVGIKATFFVLGWVAEHFPTLVQRIATAGHEIASHGYEHRLVFEQTPREFASDLKRSIDAIGSACGVRVDTYRAPSFSIVQRSLWALDVLTEHGFKVDSSIFPISGHDRYGMPGAKRNIHRLETRHGAIVEFPPSAWHWGKLNLPIGGGYFRILPLSLTLKACRMVQRAGRPVMFYIHPWEIDPEQPRLNGLSRKTRLRHYTGLKRTKSRLTKLLTTFNFSTIAQVLQAQSESQSESQAQSESQSQSLCSANRLVGQEE